MTTSSKLNFRSCQPKHILTNRTVNLFQDRACAIENILIAFENTIRLSAHILIASAHALIVFLSATNKAATKRKHTPPQSLFFLVGEEIAHCPSTVPGGDTLCVTAGDARRVNPWDGDADNFPTPAVSHNIHKNNLSCKA